MAHGNESGNLARVFKRAAYPVDTYRAWVQVAGVVDATILWQLHEAAGVASFTIYSAITSVRSVLDALDPADTAWTDETAAGGVFTSNPADAVGNGKAWISPNPGLYALMIEMVVTTELDDFEMTMRGQGRGG